METTGRKYTECKYCGAEAIAPRWHKGNNKWIHEEICWACRNFKAKHKFTLTRADREKLGEPRCSICGTTEGKMCVDHDHSTNKVRGWLCDLHNAALGKFTDNIEHLQAAIEYLNHHAIQQKEKRDQIYEEEIEARGRTPEQT